MSERTVVPSKCEELLTQGHSITTQRPEFSKYRNLNDI